MAWQDAQWITVAPIISIAREDTPLPALKQHLAAVAIMFDFMNPVLPLWRLIDRGSKLWLEAPDGDARASSALQEGET